MHRADKNQTVHNVNEKKATGLPPDLQNLSLEYIDTTAPESKSCCVTKSLWLLAIKEIVEIASECEKLPRERKSNPEGTACLVVCGIPLVAVVATIATPFTLIADGGIKGRQAYNNFKDSRTASLFFSMNNTSEQTDCCCPAAVRQEMM